MLLMNVWGWFKMPVSILGVPGDVLSGWLAQVGQEVPGLLQDADEASCRSSVAAGMSSSRHSLRDERSCRSTGSVLVQIRAGLSSSVELAELGDGDC